MSAIEVSADTVIAVIITAVVTGVVPAILLVIKIINEREARIADRMNAVAERAAAIEVLERESRANVKELWEERDSLKETMVELRKEIANHSRQMKAARPPDSA